MTWDLGVFSIEEVVFDWLVQNVPKGGTILECGSGAGTGKLAAAGFRMVSIEHSSRWLKRYSTTYVYAPLRPGIGWYDDRVLKEQLQGVRCDAILVDGPVAVAGQDTRRGFLRNIDLFLPLSGGPVPIVLDDTNRADEAKLASDLKTELTRRYGREVTTTELRGPCKTATILF
jgi:hypothetical protein